MEIKLDDKVIESELNSQADKAIKDALGSYRVKNAIEENVASVVVAGMLGRAIDDAVKEIDLTNLSQKLAEQLSKTVISGTVTLLRESMVDTIYKLRFPGYMNDEKKEKEKERIKTELRKEHEKTT